MVEKIKQTLCNADPALLAASIVVFLLFLTEAIIIGGKELLIVAAIGLAMSAVLIIIGIGLYAFIKWAQTKCKSAHEGEDR